MLVKPIYPGRELYVVYLTTVELKPAEDSSLAATRLNQVVARHGSVAGPSDSCMIRASHDIMPTNWAIVGGCKSRVDSNNRVLLKAAYMPIPTVRANTIYCPIKLKIECITETVIQSRVQVLYLYPQVTMPDCAWSLLMRL